MLSPRRATFKLRNSRRPAAARIHAASRSCVSGSCQWPTITFRGFRSRVQMWPNSRSPCAAWFRFMKSMSIASQGRSRLNCVCRWANGFSSAFRPSIHIFAGEKVCIQQITPMQRSAALASRHAWRIDSAVVTTLRNTTGADRDEAFSPATTWRLFASTCRSGPSP